MNRIRLLLADDHMLFAEGLQSLLHDEFELLGTVGNGRDLVEATLRLNPEVILVDISMPVLNGFDAVRRIRKDGNAAKVIDRKSTRLNSSHSQISYAVFC